MTDFQGQIGKQLELEGRAWCQHLKPRSEEKEAFYGAWAPAGWVKATGGTSAFLGHCHLDGHRAQVPASLLGEKLKLGAVQRLEAEPSGLPLVQTLPVD